MPAYERKIRNELERWQVVLFVRQLGREAPAAAR